MSSEVAPEAPTDYHDAGKGEEQWQNREQHGSPQRPGCLGPVSCCGNEIDLINVCRETNRKEGCQSRKCGEPQGRSQSRTAGHGDSKRNNGGHPCGHHAAKRKEVNPWVDLV